jgi:amidase
MGAITYTPTKNELAYTFGARLPVAHLKSGDVLSTFTEDCFGGAVSTVDDRPSTVCRLPYVNPVTGPSGGAESGSDLFVALFPWSRPPSVRLSVCDRCRGHEHQPWGVSR